MATIIDALVVTLGLDSSNFTSGQRNARADARKSREEITKDARETEDRQRKLGETINGVRKEVLGMFAAFTAGAGLTQFVTSTVNSEAATGRLSKQIGVATEQLSAWQGVLARTGGTAGEADNALGTISKAFQEIQLTGNSPLIPYLQTLKLSMNDLKDPSETLLKISDAFSKMDPRRAAALGSGMGFSPATISLLSRGREAVQRLLTEQAKISVTTQADADAAQRLQTAWGGLGQASARLGATLLTRFAPMMERASDLLLGLAKWAQEHEPIVEGAFVALGVVAVGLGFALAAPLLPFIALAAAAVAVGAGFGAMMERSPELRQAVGQLGGVMGELGGTLGQIAGAIGEAFGTPKINLVNVFTNAVVSTIRAVSDAVRVVNALLHGDLAGAGRAALDFNRDMSERLNRPMQENARPAPTALLAGVVAATAATLRQFEGYAPVAKWDRNAFRGGYGSDTHTDAATGRVSRVQNGERISRADAEADLNRRLTTDFIPRAARSVGAAWTKLTDSTKAAIVSAAYNYGSLDAPALRVLRAAAQRGDTAGIAAALEARRNDNGGVNAGRRMTEAALVNLRPSQIQLAQNAATNDNRRTSTSTSTNETNIGTLNVQTAATDARGIARDLPEALRRRGVTTQANTGLA